MTKNSSTRSTNSGGRGGGSGTTRVSGSQYGNRGSGGKPVSAQTKATSKTSTYTKGTNYSPADYVKAGYNQYRTTSDAIKYGGKAQPVRLASTGASPKTDRETVPTGSNRKPYMQNNYAAYRQPPSVPQYPDSKAASIENRVAQRVATGPKIKGISTEGRTVPSKPPVSPMAGQGLAWPGPTSPLAGRPSFPGYQGALTQLTMDVYNRGKPAIPAASPTGGGPPRAVASTPQAPGQKYNVLNSLLGNTNPSQEVRVVPEFVTRLPGAIGLIGSGINKIANLPGDGPGPAPGADFPSQVGGSGGGGLFGGGMAAHLGDLSQYKNSGAVSNPAASSKSSVASAVAPTSPAGLVNPQFLYPRYSQTWAGLPVGLYGRG